MSGKPHSISRDLDVRLQVHINDLNSLLSSTLHRLSYLHIWTS